MSGAIGVEMQQGSLVSLYGEQHFLLQVLTNIEEIGEMVGTTLFLYALLVYIREHLTEVRVQIQLTTEDRK